MSPYREPHDEPETELVDEEVEFEPDPGFWLFWISLVIGLVWLAW
jgi:hypothetical protein